VSDGQGVDAGRGDRVPQVAAVPAAGDVDGRRHGGGAGDVPDRDAPVHAAGGGVAARGLHAQVAAVHGAGAGAEPAGDRSLRALPRRRQPAAAGPDGTTQIHMMRLRRTCVVCVC
jgi:hypothetical protein